MILKFDHISYSCEKKSVGSLPIISGYTLQFQELALNNINCKQCFFEMPHQDHNIYMYEGTRDLPIEVTAYDTCFHGSDSMDVEDGTVIMYSPNPEKTAEFLALFGLKKERMDGDEFVLAGRFALGGVTFRIRKKDAVEWKLDKTGWSSVAFWSSNIAKELDRIQTAGYDVTHVEELEVNHRQMKIGFCKGPFGEIVEMIGSQNRK